MGNHPQHFIHSIILSQRASSVTLIKMTGNYMLTQKVSTTTLGDSLALRRTVGLHYNGTWKGNLSLGSKEI